MEEGLLISDKQDTKPNMDANQRLAICRQCPLFLHDQKVCNPYLWMNPTTREISKKEKAGFIKGCGCLISRKAMQPGSHCHLGLW